MKEDEMSEELRPCPFCGKDEAYLMTDKWGNYYVECEYCGAQINPYDDKEIIVEGWQSRPIEDDLRKRITELEEKHKVAFGLVRTLRRYCIYAHWNNPDIEDEFNEFDEEICKYISENKEREE